MGKIDLKKKVKENALFQNAFELFTDKGFAKTTISDIVNQAGLAKGTFYLYFKDKYDLRDKLIVHKASQLFTDAHQAVMEAQVDSFEKQLLFITDYIINCFKEQHSLLQFIAKIYLGAYSEMPSIIRVKMNHRLFISITCNLWNRIISYVKNRRSCFSQSSN